MKQKAILATTHIDRHGMCLSKEALDKAAIRINNGHKLLLTIEHDLTVPPFGKGIEAIVEVRDDGEHQLVLTNEYFEDILWASLPDGTPIFKQESKTDRHPFADRYDDKPERERVEFDTLNFVSLEDRNLFISEAIADSKIKFEVRHFGRKSYIPDPEFVIWVAEGIGLYLIGKKLVDKTADKLSDLAIEEVTNFYKYVKGVVLSAAKNARKGRLITYVFVLPLVPTVEFIARTTNPNMIISALLLEKMEKALTHLNYFQESLGAVRIQYLLNDNGEWEFNYLLTKEGAVIGTDESLNRRQRRIEIFNAHLIEKSFREKNDENAISESSINKDGLKA